MKHVIRLLVLLLLVNCTTDSTSTQETVEISTVNLDMQTCINDAPKIRLTNNGTHSFEFVIYSYDYNVLHFDNISVASNSGWVELSENDVIAVASNDIAYGQKIPLNLQMCDNLELEIDTNNILVMSTE